MSNSNNWLDEVVKRVENVGGAVPDGAWEAISRGVARNKRRKRAVTVTLATLLGAAAAITPFVLFRGGETGGNEPLVQTPYIAQNEVSAAIETAVSEPKAEERAVSSPVVQRGSKVSEPETAATVVETVDPEAVEPEKREAPEKKEEPVKTAEPDFDRLLASLPEEDETPRRKISITVGGNLGLASDRSDDIWNVGVVSATKAPEMEFAGSPGFFYGLPLSKKAASGETNSVRSSAFSYRHHFPVSARIAISYPFSERIAAETGISYTLLSSSILSPSATGTETSMQTLHFVGLPVNLRYTICEIGRSSLYASAGGAMEKCVSAKINGKPFNIKPLFWSANCGAGYQVSIARGLGLFLEAGGSYHLRNDAASYTVYDENPLQFSLQAGLRIQ
ncbi:MAG: hypothetical protein J5699_08280 [Bacteroidales bacterium]|nr:hypothetical protein [Bacteroidales bacterium]